MKERFVVKTVMDRDHFHSCPPPQFASKGGAGSDCGSAVRTDHRASVAFSSVSSHKRQSPRFRKSRKKSVEV